MAVSTERDRSDQGRGALRARAANPGHNVEPEATQPVESAVVPDERIRLGSLLAEIGREACLTDEELAVFEQVRDSAPASPERWSDFEAPVQEQRL